jgi:hypothetical protein
MDNDVGKFTKVVQIRGFSIVIAITKSFNREGCALNTKGEGRMGSTLDSERRGKLKGSKGGVGGAGLDKEGGGRGVVVMGHDGNKRERVYEKSEVGVLIFKSDEYITWFKPRRFVLTQNDPIFGKIM